MKFLSNINYHDEVDRLFSNGHTLDVAVAFFGSDAVSLIKPDGSKKIRIICNLESSACNPYAIRMLQKYTNVNIKTNKRLHAKVLVQEHEVIIGSANLSANGLSFEGSELDGWIESGVLIRDNQVVTESRNWFCELWESSCTVTNELLDLSEHQWKRKRNQRTSVSTKDSLLSAAKNNIDNFIDREIYFVMYRNGRLSQEAEDALTNAKAAYSSLTKKIGCYEGWSEIPDNSYLIDIYYGPKGGVSISGIYQTPNEPLVEAFSYGGTEQSEGEIKLCFKKNSIYGHKLTKNDESILKVHVKQLWDYDPNEETSIIPFIEGLRIVEKASNV